MGPDGGEAGAAEPGNQLTDEARWALLWLTQEGARRKPAVSYVKGHRDVYATHCPGDQLYAYVPFLSAHLHGAPTKPIDWTAIKRLAFVEAALKRDPLDLGDNRPIVVDVKKVLALRGYEVDVDSPEYGSGMRKGVHEWKRTHPETFPNADGTIVGAPFWRSILRG